MKKKRSNFNTRHSHFHNCVQVSSLKWVVGYFGIPSFSSRFKIKEEGRLLSVYLLTRHMCVQQRSQLCIRLLKDLFLRAKIEPPSNYQTPCLPYPWCRGAWNDGYILFPAG